MTKILLLLLILLLAGFMAFIPHIGYAYPLHVDEWTHLTYAKTIAQTGSISFPDPFTGEGTAGPGTNVWLGYHVLMAMVQKASGIDWLVLWRFSPSVIFMLTVLCIYIFANKQGYGLEAAFFTCLIPTTGGLLGPAFMVPMALGLLFIPLSLYLAFYVKSWPSYLLLFLITCFLWSMHPTTSAIQGIILLPFIIINLKGSPRRGLGLLASLLLPVLIALPFTIKQLLPEIGRLLTPIEVFPPPSLDIPAILQIYGFLPLIFCFIGIIYLFQKGGRFNYGLLLGLIVLLGVMLSFARFQVGMETLFVRGISTALLLISIIAGAGLYRLRTQVSSERLLAKYKPRFTVYGGGLLCALSVVVILALAIPARFNVPYYHMIDEDDYQAFIWIRGNVEPGYETALVDPWKATAFTAVTGKKVAHRIWVQEELPDVLITRYLRSGCAYTALLRDSGLSFIYSRLPVNNPDLIQVMNNVYLAGTVMGRPAISTDEFQNGSFESVRGKPPDKWGKWSSKCEVVFLYPAPGRGPGDSVAINITRLVAGTKGASAHWANYVPVIQGHKYFIEGWLKTENIRGNGGAMLVPHWINAEGKTIGATPFMENVTGTVNWSYYKGSVIAPQDASICAVLCHIADCTGIAYFDDIDFNPE